MARQGIPRHGGACRAKDRQGFARFVFWVALASTIAATPFRNPVHADEKPALMPGNRLWDACNRPDADGGYCGGYVAGVADSMTAERPHPAACLPSGVAADQLVDIVKLYLSRHPENVHFGAFEAIFLGLFSPFPCPR